MSCHQTLFGNASSLATASLSVYRSSVQLLLSHFDNLEVTVAESDEESVSEGVPGNGGHLVELVSLGLLGSLLRKVLLALKLEAALTDHGRVLGLEVPNLPSDFSSDSDPVGPGVESECID